MISPPIPDPRNGPTNRPPVVSPTTVDEAVTSMAERPELYVVHGGTDVMVAVNEGRTEVAGWLSLRRLRELARIERDGEAVTLGAGVTFAAIERDLAACTPGLAAAARTVGSPQIRRAGTVGGNIATASPAADSVPALLCHDAEVELRSRAGTRWVPLEQFTTGPKRTVRRDDELITAVHLPSTGGIETFAKVGTRNAMVISVCSLAARLDPARGVARVAIGSVAPVVRRVRTAEAALLDREAADEFAAEVVGAASPIDDARASAAYRRHALGVLARRAHARLWRDVAEVVA